MMKITPYVPTHEEERNAWAGRTRFDARSIPAQTQTRTFPIALAALAAFVVSFVVTMIVVL